MDLLHYAFMQRALLASVLIGLAAPSVGVYLVQRRLSLIGDGLGHVALAGVGLFTDRSGAAAIADLLHSRPGGLSRVVLSDPPYPDPAASVAGAPRGLVALAPDVQIPRTLQYSLSVDRALRKGLTMSLAYNGSHGYDQFRSRDVNAPAPPLYSSRPDPAFGAIRQIE